MGNVGLLPSFMISPLQAHTYTMHYVFPVFKRSKQPQPLNPNPNSPAEHIRARAPMGRSKFIFLSIVLLYVIDIQLYEYIVTFMHKDVIFNFQ